MSVDLMTTSREFCTALVAEATADRRANRRVLRDGVWSHMELQWQAYMEPTPGFPD